MHRLIQNRICLSLRHLIGANLIGEAVDEVGHHERVDEAEEKIHVQLQPGLSARLLHPGRLLKEDDPEAAKAGVVEGEPVLRLVHAETARAARSGSEEDIILDNLLFREPLLLQFLEVLNEVSYRKVGGVALAVVAVLLAHLKGLHRRDGEVLRLIAEAFEGGLAQ